VAASGLAVLNHIFFWQRQYEFAVLNALGYGRQLIWRVLGETAFATGVAWALAAIICLAASAGTAAWDRYRVDPVATIERRSWSQ
jgi:hypothetical protein